MKTCFEARIAWDIKLEQAANRRFRVTYGAEKHSGLTYDEAALKLGACIMHALACEDKLDNGGA